MRIIIAGVILLFTPVMVYASEVKFPPLNGPVVDAANQIPEDQEKILTNELKSFRKDSGHQFVVVTVPDLQDLEPSDYALKFGRYHGIGRKDINDGIILLQYPGDGSAGSAKIRLEVGPGMEYILTDLKLSQIIRDVMAPIVKQNRPRSETMPEAILAGAREVMRLGRVTEEQKLEFDKKVKEAFTKRQKEIDDSWSMFFSYVSLIIFLMLSVFGIYRFSTRKTRQRKKEEQVAKEEADLKASNLAYRKRVEEANRAAAVKKATRENMLNAMSPVERARFLHQEEHERQVQHARSLEAARQRDLIEARRRREEEERRSSSDSYSDNIPLIIGGSFPSDDSNDSSSDTNDNYGGDGGTFDGGGAGGDL